MNDDRRQPILRRSAATADDITGVAIGGGRYQVQRIIATGGMATVYLAQDTLLNRPVAVKVLSGRGDAHERDAFLREARAVAQLSHPHIVEVYDAGVEGDLRYIVMQYVPGETLRDVINREAPLEPHRAVALATRLADALDFGHRRGIVHCDVKPGNVLLGDHGEPKIVDFGIARGQSGALQDTETIAGTAAYIAPEQVQGGPLDGRADVYSLAAVLYEMLTGAPPHAGESLAAIASRGGVRPPPPLRDRNPSVPPALEAAVTHGLQPDPNLRPASAAAFADELRASLDDDAEQRTRRITRRAEPHTERIAVGPAPGLAYPVQPPVERRSRRLFYSAAGALALMLAGLLIVLAVNYSRGPGTSTTPAVTGQSIDEAARRIHAVGLTVGTVQLTADPAPFGTVIGQTPTAAETQRRGDAVDLRVSLGSQTP